MWYDVIPTQNQIGERMSPRNRQRLRDEAHRNVKNRMEAGDVMPATDEVNKEFRMLAEKRRNGALRRIHS